MAMQLKVLIFTIACGFASQVLLAAQFTEILPVSTYINKALLYPYSLSLTATPSSFLLLFDKSQNRFYDAHSELLVKTEIPAEESATFTYKLTLTQNQSECRRVGSTGTDTVLSNVMDVLIDGTKIDEGDSSSLQVLDEIDEGGRRMGRNSLTLRSHQITEEAFDCNGSIKIEAELAL
ncbi:hypothetical protein L4D09_22490 [Photobacterium makurazakiensis]|uniref:hypothetical protein n=1 Tax=Photobacterium makurazakiensis TaxID=2910234 RepID=UPI003D0AF534